MDAIERAAFRVLVSELGWFGAVRVGLRVRLDAARGRPFGDLPPAVDDKERGSRAQAGPATLLYSALLPRMPRDEALRITGRIVEEGAMVFLGATVGELRREEIARLDDAERRTMLEERLDRFPNATASVEVVEADHVRFLVSRCRLVELVRHAGHPELAPLFCAADGRFFRELPDGVRLDRPTTLADGAEGCPFDLRWMDG